MSGGDAPGDASGDNTDRRRRRGLLLLFLLLAVALFAALWLTIAWPFAKDAPPPPAGVTETSSQPRTTPAGGEQHRSSQFAADVPTAESPADCSAGVGSGHLCPSGVLGAADSDDPADPAADDRTAVPRPAGYQSGTVRK